MRCHEGITAATRLSVRERLAQFEAVDDVQFPLEGTTGWRFVVEEIARAGHRAHPAHAAETAARRGRKRRAKTDRADCDLLLRLLSARELPESWIPPAQIREALAKVALSPAGLELVALALRMIDTIDDELAPFDRALSLYARVRSTDSREEAAGPSTLEQLAAPRF